MVFGVKEDNKNLQASCQIKKRWQASAEVSPRFLKPPNPGETTQPLARNTRIRNKTFHQELVTRKR